MFIFYVMWCGCMCCCLPAPLCCKNTNYNIFIGSLMALNCYPTFLITFPLKILFSCLNHAGNMLM